MFSVQLVYKTSVQKIELNQNEFPMKHTQVIYHTTIKNQRHPNTTIKAYNAFKRYITQLSISLRKWWPFLLCTRSQSLNLLGKLRHQKLVIPVEHNSIQILSVPINNTRLQNNKTNYQKSWHIKRRIHNQPNTEKWKAQLEPTSLFWMFSTIFSPS